MKMMTKTMALVLVAIFLFSFSSNQEGDTNLNQDKAFATPEEAAAKGKSDLVQALEMRKDLKLGIDLARLREAQQARLVRYGVVDFGKIIASKSVTSLGELVSSYKSMIAPFAQANEVVAVVEVAKSAGGWEVTALGNKPIRDDLNQAGILRQGQGTLTLYEVPNLQVRIYSVKGDRGERYFLNFEKFTLKDSVALSVFFPALRERAIRFEKEFGDQLKKERLVE